MFIDCYLLLDKRRPVDISYCCSTYCLTIGRYQISSATIQLQHHLHSRIQRHLRWKRLCRDKHSHRHQPQTPS
uniref:Uncharacterized protein n=1 Tax=Arundo donax TaxID=35708 RepID=A0A0A9GD39_ARUDO